MKYTASVSFCGALTMAKGQTAEVPDETALPLVECGYLEAAEQEKKTTSGKKSGKSPPKKAGGAAK
ncbi:MAG: hypothetical protein VB039_03235 [Oscillospiraceae bacterium]|nr:hypothetical protein [Oscillospiraceae bacterium]